MAQDKAKASEKAVATQNKVDESEEIVFQRLTGFYFEGRGGVFLTFAGSRGYSNGQPFFGFEFGYDITDELSVQVAYASGYQAANPIKDPLEDPTYKHYDFGLTFFNLSADYDVWGGKRFALEARLGGGVVLISPEATPDQCPIDGDIFAGFRFEYYSLLRHFTFGAEVDFYFVMPTMIPALSASISVLYNF
ncbi:MAG: adventurous gliding motility protein CglE [Deltaproteobacteria bacterium]|nr:adventurous gliding motility protein CglE [Deltaproteobacteria bacterium]